MAVKHGAVTERPERRDKRSTKGGWSCWQGTDKGVPISSSKRGGEVVVLG